MRISTIDNRFHVIRGEGSVDVAAGKFAPDGFDIYERWADLTDWAGTLPDEAFQPFDATRLGAPVPLPRQVFAIGLNYRDHAAEANLAEPDAPLVFTKFPT